MLSRSAVRKGLSILIRPHFFKTLVRYRVAAACEHLDAIRLCAANTLIDAGANKGQFSVAFRGLRPYATILAFEPLPEAAEVFESVFGADHRTTLTRVALAGQPGIAQFHVANRADSSSLLRPGRGQESAFGVLGASTIDVSLARLDECIDMGKLEKPIMLKVDVQGGELAVFEGCARLESIDFIYVELSFVELYDNQPLFADVFEYLVDRGFAVAGAFNQVATVAFGPTQVDVLFRRSTKGGG